MFTPEERSQIRERVFEVARADPRTTGAALTGSASIGAEDEWSDVDTSFGIAEDADPREVLDDWTASSTASSTSSTWLAALVARMALARNRPWQALLFVNLLRDQALGLACIRHGEPPEYARGTDKLPRDVTEPYERALPRSLELDELRRALVAATTELLREVEHVKPDLAARLAGVFT